MVWPFYFISIWLICNSSPIFLCHRSCKHRSTEPQRLSHHPMFIIKTFILLANIQRYDNINHRLKLSHIELPQHNHTLQCRYLGIQLHIASNGNSMGLHKFLMILQESFLSSLLTFSRFLLCFYSCLDFTLMLLLHFFLLH